VYFALNELKKSKKLKKAMLIISDGLDNNSRYTEREVLNAVEESEVLIYAAGEGGLQSAIGDRQVLPDLIEATGGLFLGDIRRVITDMRNRYIVGFSPTDKTRDGRYHRLTVKVTPPKGLPKVSAHWKTGYYAPVQ
jgi:Ca-activated chloride channel family protein